MNWFLIALIPPAIWSATNYFDKYLISRYFKGDSGVGALMMFSSVIEVFILGIIAIIHPEVLRYPFSKGIFIALNGFVYLLATLPYLYALKKDETSIAVPMFQLIPAFTYFLAWLILGETLNKNQLFGGILIIIGAIIISLGLSETKKIVIKKEVLLLMAISSLFFSLNFLLFKYFAINATFWVTSFWEYTGFAIFSFLLFVFIRKYRDEFISIIKVNKATVLTLNGINEVLNIIAKIAFNFASLLTPITLTWIVNGFQPLFVFFYGIILTLFFPHISKENISKRHLAHKIIAISIILIGTFFINIK
ncbi:MAG: EamA family transporter [Patescibacteria group bacterium]